MYVCLGCGEKYYIKKGRFFFPCVWFSEKIIFFVERVRVYNSVLLRVSDARHMVEYFASGACFRT